MVNKKKNVNKLGKPIRDKGKVTFDAIYKDFRRRHPHLAKEIIHWKPHDVLKIKIFMFDGMIIIYDYWDHRATICSANWKRDHLPLG